MASFMALVYGQSLIYYEFSIFLFVSAISRKAHMQAHLFLSSMHVNYTLIAHHPPKSTNKTRENANKL